MSNIVFILGAGCSNPAGAPLINEFLDTAHRLHTMGEVTAQSEHFERVFRAIGSLQLVHSKAQLDLNNIETIFNAFEIANTIRKLPGFPPDEIPRVIQSLKEVIVTTIQKTMVFPVVQARLAIPSPYDSFAELLSYLTLEAKPTQTISIITFNYDVAIDVALYLSGIRYDYCIQDTECSGIPLLKLHGSLNWASRTIDNAIIPLTFNEYFKYYRISFPHDRRSATIPIGSQLKEHFSKHSQQQVNNEPFIVPPTWSKAEHYSSINSVWARAASDLGEAQYIFIIGYSLPETDVFFRLLYALGTVSDAPLKDIQIFNPNPDIQQRFESMIGPGAKAKYGYNTHTFLDAIPRIRQRFKY